MRSTHLLDQPADNARGSDMTLMVFRVPVGSIEPALVVSARREELSLIDSLRLALFVEEHHERSSLELDCLFHD